MVRDWSAAEFETFSYDLGPPVAEVRALLRSFSTPTGSLAVALQTLRPRELVVEPDAVRLRVAIDLPSVPPVPTAPERALTRAEIQQWEALLDSWDGFLGFLVKDVAGGADAEIRTELLDLLLTARRDVTAVLGRGPEAGVDPIRPLFIRFWDRLREPSSSEPAPRDATTPGRFGSWCSWPPATRWPRSTRQPRRRASTSRPTAFAGWPGRWPRATRGPAGVFGRAGSEAPGAVPVQGPGRAPAADPPEAGHNPSLVASVLAAPSSAHAEEPDEWRELSERLDRWVPASNELPAYREIVDRLLTLAAERSFDAEALDARFDDLFRDLVKTVAWQESCWRQFVRDRSGVVPIQSSTGDFGMMQINVRVWRGFFNPVKLRWSAGYNAGAGAEILWQLLGRYGVREARERLSNAARSSYSAYHGGPRRYLRYRSARHPAGDAARRSGVLGEVPGDQRGPGRRSRPLHARETHVLTWPTEAAIGAS